MQAAKEGVQETIEVSELEVLKEIGDALVAQRTGGAPGQGSGDGPGGAGGTAVGPREDR
ncbi:large-conductance mechanosensitive channel [Streptomyces badius]